jgi:hypothetical protein
LQLDQFPLLCIAGKVTDHELIANWIFKYTSTILMTDKHISTAAAESEPSRLVGQDLSLNSPRSLPLMPSRSQHQLYYTRRKPLHPKNVGSLAHRKQAASLL